MSESSQNPEMSTYEMFLSIKQDTTQTKSDIKDIKEQLSDLGSKVDENSEDIRQLQMDQGELWEIIKQQRSRIEALERTKKKNNIIIKGIKEKDEESRSELIERVIQLFNETLKIHFHSDHINFIKRLGAPKANKERPIILSLTSWIKKTEIMFNRNKLTGTNIFISDDLSKDEMVVRRELLLYQKKFKEVGKHSSLIGTRLKVDGQLYTLKSLNENFKMPDKKEESEVNPIVVEQSPPKIKHTPEVFQPVQVRSTSNLSSKTPKKSQLGKKSKEATPKDNPTQKSDLKHFLRSRQHLNNPPEKKKYTENETTSSIHK